eukprot:1074304-Pleurochrysis_carterae.AAC.4
MPPLHRIRPAGSQRALQTSAGSMFPCMLTLKVPDTPTPLSLLLLSDGMQKFIWARVIGGEFWCPTERGWSAHGSSALRSASESGISSAMPTHVKQCASVARASEADASHGDASSRL